MAYAPALDLTTLFEVIFLAASENPFKIAVRMLQSPSWTGSSEGSGGKKLDRQLENEFWLCLGPLVHPQ